MNTPILLTVPGIMQFPYDSRNWSPHTRTWCNQHGLKSDGADYFCGPLTRCLHQERRVERVKTILQAYPEVQYDRTLMVHSNGDDLLMKALAELNWPRVQDLHLFSGAGGSDFDALGLNSALSKGRIQNIFVYVGGRDLPMRIAKYAGWMVGFGTLGLHGPDRVWPAFKDKRVRTIVRPDYGHSTWFTPANFDDTMLAVTQKLLTPPSTPVI